MPQGKLFMDKQNLSLQRQKQSRSSWKEITCCFVNNSYGFSSSLMRVIQDNPELCRSYLSWDCNHFTNVHLKMRGNRKRANSPPTVKSPRPQGKESISPHSRVCTRKLNPRGLVKGPHSTQRLNGAGQVLSRPSDLVL